MFNRFRKRRWKKLLKKTEPYSFNFSLAVLMQSLEDILDESLDYMFMPEVETMCFELIETIANLRLMIETKEEEEYNMLKHRVMYMLNHKLENWYI